jgi:hypothetical protein
MNRNLEQRSLRWWEADFFSPKDFVRHAVLICVVFAVAHLFGLREFTSVLNGTTGSTELGWQVSAVLGVTYIFFYLAFVLLTPTLLLAAAILTITRKFFSQNGSSKT